MRTLEPSWRRALRVWWAYTWRTALWILIPAMALFALPLPQDARPVVNLANAALIIWSQIFTFKSLLKMDFEGFTVRIIDAHSK